MHHGKTIRGLRAPRIATLLSKNWSMFVCVQYERSVCPYVRDVFDCCSSAVEPARRSQQEKSVSIVQQRVHRMHLVLHVTASVMISQWVWCMLALGAHILPATPAHLEHDDGCTCTQLQAIDIALQTSGTCSKFTLSSIDELRFTSDSERPKDTADVDAANDVCLSVLASGLSVGFRCTSHDAGQQWEINAFNASQILNRATMTCLTADSTMSSLSLGQCQDPPSITQRFAMQGGIIRTADSQRCIGLRTAAKTANLPCIIRRTLSSGLKIDRIANTIFMGQRVLLAETRQCRLIIGETMCRNARFVADPHF